ncbi:hypothetical protein GF314_06745 [bacterium]|nr:hypothetical protein [bacterium]
MSISIRIRHAVVIALAASLILGAAATTAAVPETMSLQGVATDASGARLPDGPHDLTVRIYDGPDGSAQELWQEQQQIQTVQGQFHVILGSQNPLNLPFDQPYWVSTEIDGGGEMSPRIPLTGSPYALNARSVDDGAAVTSLNGLTDQVTVTGNGGITVSEVGSSIVIDGAGGSGGDSDWLVVGDDMHAIPTGAVGIGTDAPEGDLHVHDDGGGTSIVVSDLTEGVGFHDAYIQLETPFGNSRLEFFSAGSPPQSTLSIHGGGGEDEAHIRVGGRSLTFDTEDDIAFEFGGTERARFNDVGQLVLQDSDETTTTMLLNGNPYGRAFLFQSDADEGLDLSAGGQYGGHVIGSKADGGTGFFLRAERSGTNEGGMLSLSDGDGSAAVLLQAMQDGSQGTAGGQLRLYPRGSTTETVTLEAQESGASDQGGQISIHNEGGLATVVIDGDQNTTDGGAIQLRDASGDVNVSLRADASGEGRIRTDVLEITAGADLSERFDVRAVADSAEPRPGMVVGIDAERPGELTLTARPYDTRVAGVISGAGGVKPGMLMGQRGSVADGEYPVALTGRVYVRADASDRPIVPGDLLTTSSTPGHAMAVGDHGRATGAVLGKAMTGLESGQGLVLVLVSLQ